ncbi:universal stress protein [Ramlibacter humi]|uniref:Universal stress protein n=1 Tax=Ramlibacter humi TaxID=2530451 RepID=A0A4Z0C815_9BURK|nr:universal stress protein [Ramlibacter humi]TFZ07827.1 universal stress protein [Ramlibacter humi]
MKIILAADGSKFTKKALAFLVNHESLAEADEIVVLNVQQALPPRVVRLAGSAVVRDYHQDEAEMVLAPIRKFLDRKDLPHRCEWKVGDPAQQVLATAQKEKAHLIMMGTHGHGLVGRAIMGSVAQRVLQGAEIPVLLVR